MDGLRIEREHLRRVVREAMGIPHSAQPLSVWNLQAIDTSDEILAMPEDVDEMDELQNVTTGALFFMVGISAIDGPDALG